MKRCPTRDLLILMAIGLAVRVLYTLWVVRACGAEQFSDFLYLHQLAESMAAGRGFTIDGIRIFNQSVGYPAFLSIFYRIFGPRLWVAFAINAVLGALGVGLVYLVTRCLCDRIGMTTAWPPRAAALLAAVYPDSLLYGALAASENLLIPLLLLLALVLLRPLRNDWIAGGLVGFLAALAATVKAHVLVLCIFVPLAWWLTDRRVARRTAAAAVLGALCLAPWTIINYRASGHLVPFAAISGTVMLDGNNPSATGSPSNRYSLAPEEERGLHPVELDRRRMQRAVHHIRNDPGWFLRLSAKRFILSFSPIRDFMFEHGGKRLFVGLISRWLPTMFNAMLLGGSLLGLFAVRRRRAPFVIGLAVFLTPVIIQTVFLAYSRYRFPFLFCMLPYVGIAAGQLIERLAGSHPCQSAGSSL